MTLPHKLGNLIAPIKRGGSLFAYTDDGKTIQLWDVVTCLPIAQLKGHSTPVSKVAFSPDKTIIASGDEQGVIILWDASTYTPTSVPLSRPDKLPIEVKNISISGNKIVVLYEADCIVWDIGNHTLVNITAFDQPIPGDDTIWTSHNLDTRLNPGSTLLIRRSEGRRDWKVEAVVDSLTGQNVVLRFSKGSKMLKNILVSPNNQVVVTVDRKKAISMLHASSGETIGSPILVSQSAEAREPRIRFSGQNGRRLIVLTQGNGRIYVYDYNGVLMAGPIESGCSSTGADTRWTYITATALSFDETRLVASTSKKHSNIMIWDVASAQLIATLDYLRAPFPQSLSLSPDNSKVVLSSEHGVVVWHVETNIKNGVKSWDTSPQSSVTDVVIAPRGRGLLVGQKDGLTILYHDWKDVTARSPLIGGRFPACFSPDATTIITTSIDYSLLHWASGTSHLVGNPWRGHQGPVMSIVSSTDGQVLSLSKDRTIRTWDLGSGQQTRAPIRVSDSIQAITMSRDSSWIVAAYGNGPDVELLVDDSGQTVGQCIKDYLWRYAEFMSEGREILCSTSNGQSRRLDCETGKLLTFPSTRYAEHPQTTPAGHDQGNMSRYKTILPTNLWDSSVTTSLDGKYVAYMTNDLDWVYIGQSNDGSLLCLPLYLPHDTGPLKLAFSPDSTRLAALFPGGDVQIWNLKDILTHEIVPAIHTYPADRIRTVNQIQACRSDGWLRGEAGLRLLWLPDNLRDVWVATPEQRGHRALVAGREEAVVVDMEDFLKTLDGSGGWRAGGVQYIVDESYTALALDRNAAYVTKK